MKLTDIIKETTSAGAIATVAAPMTKKMQRRMSDASIYGQPEKKKKKKEKTNEAFGIGSTLPEKDAIIRFVSLNTENALKLAELGIQLDGEDSVEVLKKIREDLITIQKYLRTKKKKKKANEGDVVNFPQKKKPKVCSCPYDDEDDTKDLGIDPNCPYHGKNK